MHEISLDHDVGMMVSAAHTQLLFPAAPGTQAAPAAAHSPSPHSALTLRKTYRTSRGKYSTLENKFQLPSPTPRFKFY